MTEDLYRIVSDDSVIIARWMKLDIALLLIKALMNEYYNEPYLAYTIVRESDQYEEKCDDGKQCL